MAADYTSGSASSLTDLRDALEGFLTTSCGWSAAAGTGTNRLLSKGDLFIRIGTTATQFYLYGGTGISGTALTGESAAGAMMASPSQAPISFPVSFEIYWNDTPEEVYMLINYNGDKYQNLEFGESDIPDIGGTGLWFDGSRRVGDNITSGNNSYMYMGFGRDSSGNGSFSTNPYDGVRGGFMCVSDQSWSNSGGIHCALEGAAAWRQAGGLSAGNLRGQNQSGPLMTALPSKFNESEVLLPIYFTMQRVDSVATVVAVMRHARMMRIDNINPGDIITYGSDQWKCYPLYAKNTVARNGSPWNIGIAHSGTYGIALRYPGV